MKYQLVFCAFCVLVLFCQSQADHDDVLSRRKRVIGGVTINEGDFPWLVHFSAYIPTNWFWGIGYNYKTYSCGGSIINRHWIVSAAHCFNSSDPQDRGVHNPHNWQVTVGEVDTDSDFWEWTEHVYGLVTGDPEMRRWTVSVSEVIVHPLYNESDTWLHDIALVRVAEPLPVDEGHGSIGKVRLPSDEFGSVDHANIWPREEDFCIVKGWGCTASGGPVQTHAHAVRLPVVESGECVHRSVGPTRICAGNVGRLSLLLSFTPDVRADEQSMAERGICAGDSGGPLVCMFSDGKWVQAGIASYTSHRNPGSFPGVFTRVSYYYTWIEKTLQEFAARQQLTTQDDE